jgi:hypothetical protein
MSGCWLDEIFFLSGRISEPSFMPQESDVWLCCADPAVLTPTEGMIFAEDRHQLFRFLKHEVVFVLLPTLP